MQVYTLNTNCVFASMCYKVKSVGKLDAVVPHVQFDVAWAGNVTMVEL